MHKYQPRLHIIRSSELTQLPWAPQQAFVFPETEFVAVTAYQVGNYSWDSLNEDGQQIDKGSTGGVKIHLRRDMTDSFTDRELSLIACDFLSVKLSPLSPLLDDAS